MGPRLGTNCWNEPTLPELYTLWVRKFFSGVSSALVDGLEWIESLDFGEERGLFAKSKFEFLRDFLKVSKPEIRLRNSSETT